MGKIRINKKVFEKLCEIQCTETEICDFFHVSEEQLDKWCREDYRHSFSDVYVQQRAKGIIKLRYMQIKLAEKNQALARWLGIQYLGQVEKNDNSQKTTVQIIDDIKALHEIVMHPAPNRNIEDFEN